MSELIDEILMLHGRKIIVADSEIDLSTINMNDIFILFVEESRGSAGGRAAWFRIQEDQQNCKI